MRCVRYATKLAAEVCLQCWEHSHAYLLYEDKTVGETAAPEGWCFLSCVRLDGSMRCVVVLEMCMGRRV